MGRLLKKYFLALSAIFIVALTSYAGNSFFVPSVNTEPVSNISNQTATSGGNSVFVDGGTLIDKGIVWAQYSASDDPIVKTDSVRSAGNAPTDFTLDLENLYPETRYEVRAYVVVDTDTTYGNTISFYSLSNPPNNQNVNFSTNVSGPNSVGITFNDPSTVGADGFILLRRQDGSYPNMNGIPNGQGIPGSYPAGTTFVTVLNDGTSPYADNGLDPNRTYHYSIIPFNYDGSNTSTYHYIYNVAHHSSNETTDPAEESDIVSSGNEASDIFYANYTSSTINNTSDAQRVWRFTLRDGGGSNDDDNLSTILTNLTITPGTGNTVSNWQNAINRAALFVGGTKRGETTPSGNDLTFSGLNISATQNSSAQIDLYLTFNSSAGSVVDGQRFVFSVSSASVSGSGSQLQPLGSINSQNAAGVNRIEVVAETFQLSNYPTQVDSGAVFSLDVEAIDFIGNKDLDASSQVTVSAGAIPVSSATGTTQNFVNGDYSWTDLKLHPEQVSNVNVVVSGGGLVSQNFDVLVLVAGVVVIPPDTLRFCSQNSVLPLGDIRIVEGAHNDFQLGTNVWYTIELPNGYEFVDNSSEDILFSSSSDLSGFDMDAYTNGNRRYNFRFDVTNTIQLDTLYITGLEIEKTGTGSDTLEIYREITGTIPGEGAVASASMFKNDPNTHLHGVVLSTEVENLILNSNEGSGPICEGEEVIFTAYGADTYEFFIDDVLQASSGNTFPTTDLQNNDVVKVKGYLGTCVDSAQITMSVQSMPVVNITSPNYGTIDQNNPNPIQISSDVVELEATPVGGLYSGTGVKKLGSSNFFEPEEAGVGIHSVRYNVTTGVCTVLDSIQFSVESPSGGDVSTFEGLEPKYCEDDDRSLLTWPYDETVFPVRRYNGPGVIEDPVGSGNWYFDPKLALDSAGPGLTSVYVTYGYSLLPGSEFNLSPQNTFVYEKPTVSFSVTHNSADKALPEYFCGNEQSLQLKGSPTGSFENRKIYFTISDLDNNVTDTIDANDPKVFDPSDYTSAMLRQFAITYNFTSQVSGCFNSFSDTTAILPVPRAVDDSDIQDVFYCEGESLDFMNINSGSGHYTRWFDRDNGNVISELDSIYPTIFTTGQKQYEAAFVTNDLATCQGAKKIITVTINPKPNLTLDGLSNGYCIDNDNEITITPRVNGVDPPIPGNVEFRWIRTSPDTLDHGAFTVNPVPSDYPEGNYAVSFFYTDHNHCSNTIYKPTRVNPLPTVDFAGLDSLYCADASPATLTHIISSSDNPLDNSNIIYEIDKNIQGVFTNLGVRVFDPQSILAGVGRHQIRLTYTDNYGCSSDTIKTVEVLPLPVADFVVDRFCLGSSTLFTDSSRVLSSFAGDEIISYDWNFGDGDLLTLGSGNIASGTHNGRTDGTFDTPNHAYEKSDDFIVTHLIETERGCIHSITKSIFIGEPPVADFSATGFCENDAVQFTDHSTLSSGNLVDWEWDFGDANQSDLQHPEHAYASTGRYLVKLKAYSELGCSDSIEKEIIKFSNISSLSLPYSDAFDGTKPEWVVNGDNPSWQRIAPDNNAIPIHEGNAWITRNADTTYNLLENSYVESPCFDLTMLSRPVINLDLYNDLERDVDGVVLQMTFDDGQTWHEVGDDASGVNWYNSKGLPANPGSQTTGINYGWTGDSESWTKAKYALDNYIDTLTESSRVRFRIALGSNLTNPGNIKFGGFAFDNFLIGSRNRTILFEHFTNSNLTDYSSAISTVENFVGNKDGELVNLVYHNSYPTPDDLHSFNPEDLETRSFYYGISEGPVSVIDGYQNPNPFEEWGPAYYNNETLESSPYEISIQNISEENDDVLNVGMEIISGIEGADTFNIYVVLAEKIGEMYVVREILPRASGERIEKLWSIDEEMSMNFEFHPRLYENPDEVYLVAFLQNPYTRKIYQSSIIPAGALPRRVVAGVEDPIIETDLSVYPNPFQDRLNIKLPENILENALVKIFDENGQLVFERSIVAEEKCSLHLSSLKPGVYILQFKDSKRVSYKKVLKL